MHAQIHVEPKCNIETVGTHGNCRYAHLNTHHARNRLSWRNNKLRFWTCYGYMDPDNQPPRGLGSCCMAFFRPQNGAFWNVQPPRGLGSCRKRFCSGQQRRHLKMSTTTWSRILTQVFCVQQKAHLLMTFIRFLLSLRWGLLLTVLRLDPVNKVLHSTRPPSIETKENKGRPC